MPYTRDRLPPRTDIQDDLSETRLPPTHDEQGKNMAFEHLQQQLNKLKRRIERMED